MASSGPAPRIREIDYMKGLAILGVIGIHASINFTPLEPMGPLAWFLVNVGFFLQFAVPLFIFLSGFLLSLRYGGEYSMGQFYVKRAYSILPQYLFFSLLFLAGKNLLYGPVTAMQAIFSLLTASSSYHLWFIAVIAELYLLYPLIARIYRRAEKSSLAPYLLIACLAMQVVWNAACTAIEGSGDAFTGGLLRRVFISQVFYFIAGMHLAKNPDAFKGRDIKIRYLVPAPILLTLMVAGLTLQDMLWPTLYPAVEGYSFWLFLAAEALKPPLYFSAFIMCYRLVSGPAGRGKAVLGTLGKYSFGMYLIHAAFMPPLCIALAAVGMENTNVAFYVLLFGLTVLLSYASVYLLSFLPHSALLVGAHNDFGRASGL